jgi:hypothetical protein
MHDSGPSGAKTPLRNSWRLGRVRLREYADLLRNHATQGRQKVLYAAMNRPRQAARSFGRIVGKALRDQLDRRLVVWLGPPPEVIATDAGLPPAFRDGTSSHRRATFDTGLRGEADAIARGGEHVAAG